MLQWLGDWRQLVRFERLMGRWFDIFVEHLALVSPERCCTAIWSAAT